MVDSERDDLMMRELCKNCRGSGNMACRKCHGKGVFQLRSRALRSSSDALAAGESLYCDPKTGLWRAVEQCGCPACERKGVIRCAVCFGTGKRGGNTSLRSFRFVPQIAFADNSLDAQDYIYSHVVCPAGDSGSQAAVEHAQLRYAQMAQIRMTQTSTDTQAAVANFDLCVPGEHLQKSSPGTHRSKSASQQHHFDVSVRTGVRPFPASFLPHAHRPTGAKLCDPLPSSWLLLPSPRPRPCSSTTHRHLALLPILSRLSNAAGRVQTCCRRRLGP